jgi:beta-lactamase class A
VVDPLFAEELCSFFVIFCHLPSDPRSSAFLPSAFFRAGLPECYTISAMSYNEPYLYNLMQKRRRRGSGTLKLAFWALILFGLVLGMGRVLANDDKSHPGKPLIDSFNFTDDWSFNIPENSFQTDLKNYLKDKEGDYAVYIESLSSPKPQIIKINSSDPYPAASLYKLFLLAAVEKSIEERELKEDQTITSSIAHLSEIVGEEFGYEDYTGDQLSYTVSEALTRVATISDNYAAIMLVDKIGWDKVRAQAKAIGASDTSIKDPITTTAYDIGLFFKKLYQKQVVSEQASNKIIDLLSLSRLNNRIPALLPEDNLKIVHKTGELAQVRNDAGIVFLEGNPYVIVLLSKDLKYEDDGVETLAEISKMSYEYMAGDKRN